MIMSPLKSQTCGTQWYALFVRTRYERVIGERLQEKGYETYVPHGLVQRKWADRIKVVDTPLFPNYVFCRFDLANKIPVVTTPEVRSIVGAGRIPTAVPEEEVRALQQVVLHGSSVEAVDEIPEPGRRVLVTAGALEGVEGTVIRTKGALRLVVYITLLHRGVAAEIDRDSVTLLGSDRDAARGSTSTALDPWSRLDARGQNVDLRTK